MNQSPARKGRKASMNKIQLKLDGDTWLATFSGDEAEIIQAQFGSATILTPFTAAADPQEVKREIVRRNPDYVIEVEA